MKRITALIIAVTTFIWSPKFTEADAMMGNIPAKIPSYPKHIVSINPCSDALLLKLADKRQIAAISHYSHDRQATSSNLQQALQFPTTSGTAEEILAMRPDLVLASSYVPPATVNALKRLNIPLVQLAIPQSVAESQQHISKLSKIVGAPARGQRLNKAIDDAFAKARPTNNDTIPALIWRSGGLVPGSGTLPDELLRRTGFQNVSANYGLKQWDVLSLEHLVSQPPQVLFSNSEEVKGEWLRDRKLSHPILKKLPQHINIANYPAKLLNCSGTTIIEAVTILSAARRKLRKAL